MPTLTRRGVVIGIAAFAIVAVAPAALAQSTGKKKKKKAQVVEPPPPPPAKRQNFRARRPDEIPPWEGFEDCPFGFPCVGPAPWRH